MIAARCLVVGLGLGLGCWHAPATTPTEPAAARGPAPEIAWREPAFVVRGLPAVRGDGSEVVLAIQDADGARGMANLRVVAIDRSDRERVREVVLAADDAEALIDASGPVPAVRARIAEVNTWLAAEHTARPLVPLAALVVEPGPELASASRAVAGALVVTWRDGQLVIARGGATLVDRATPPAWTTGSQTTRCHNPAYLGGAWVDATRKLAVIAIAFGGHDLCWEPATAYHVVAW